MHLAIINCSPRMETDSNTAKIVEKFREGYEKAGNTTECHCLWDKNNWVEVRKAYYGNSNLLFAVPVYAECVPGLMLEFMQTLQPKAFGEFQPKTKLSFLLQGGFAEASRLRCAEQYLEKLPVYLNCEYGGTLIKGNMFAVSLLEGQNRESLIQPFVEMGTCFAEHGSFEKERVTEFAKPEYLTKRNILFFHLMSPIQKRIFKKLAGKRGLRESLKAKPYRKYVQ